MIIINNKLSNFNGIAGLKLDNVVLDFANRFYADGGVLTANDFIALHTFVSGYKTENLFAKASGLAHYPFVGGSGNAQSVANFRHNLWSANFKLTGINVTGAMCTALGFRGQTAISTSNNGGACWNSNLNASTILTLNNTSLSTYSNINYTSGEFFTSNHTTDMGCVTSTSVASFVLRVSFFGNNSIDMYAALNAGEFILNANTINAGFFSGSRVVANSLASYINGEQAFFVSTTNAGSLPNLNVFLGALMTGWSGITQYSNRRHTMFAIAQGYTVPEENNRFKIQQVFERMLGRAVEL